MEKKQHKISKATMSRFPVYLKALRNMQHEGKNNFLSSELSEATGILDTTIRRDFSFLTSKEYLNIPKERIAVTVFEGDNTAPRDEQAYNAWKECGIEQIFYMPKKDNWWALGSGTGPCGPDSEMFYDTGKPACGPDCQPSCDCGKYVFFHI